MKEQSENRQGGARKPGPGPGVAVILLMAGSVGATLATAPLIYNALILIGRQVPSMVGLRDLEFTSVVSRMVVMLIAIGLLPALWLGGARSWSQIGLGRTPGWRRQYVSGLGLGLLTILAAVSYLLATQRYTVHVETVSALPGKLLGALLSAVIVAFFEEILFRGALFGSLRKPMGFFGAVLFSSALYSLAHFAVPVPAVGIAHAHSYSGFNLVPDLFSWPHDPSYFVPAVFTLLLVGFTLCTFYARFGSLWFGIGLHMGWIWCLLSLPDFLTVAKDRANLPFADPANLSKTNAAFVAALVLVAAAGISRWRHSRGRST